MNQIFDIIDEVIQDVIGTTRFILGRAWQIFRGLLRVSFVFLAFVFLWSIGTEMQEGGSALYWVGGAIRTGAVLFPVGLGVVYAQKVTRMGNLRLGGFSTKSSDQSIPFMVFDGVVFLVVMMVAAVSNYRFQAAPFRVVQSVVASVGDVLPETQNKWTPEEKRRSARSKETPSPTSVNPDCTVVQKESGIISAVGSANSLYVANRCLEFYFEQRTYQAVARFTKNPCPDGMVPFFQAIKGTPQLWGKPVTSPDSYVGGGIKSIPTAGMKVRGWTTGKLDIKKAVYSPFTAVTKMMCVLQ